MWYLRLVWLLFIYPNILFSAEMKSGEVCTEQNFNTLCCQGNLLTTCADRPTANYCTGCNSITLPATPSPGCAITLSCTQRTTETCCKNKPGCYWDIATTTCKKPIQCAMLNGECGGCITSLTCSQRHSQTCCDRNSSCKWSNNTCSTATCRVRNFGRYKIPPGRIGWVGWGFDGEMACNMSDDNSLVHIQYGRTKTGRCSERGTCSVSCNNNGELTRINECLPRCSSSRIPKKGVIYPGDNGFGIKPTNKSHCFPGYRGYVSGICKYDERIGFGIIQNKEDHCIRAKACGVSRKIVSPGGYSVPSNQWKFECVFSPGKFVNIPLYVLHDWPITYIKHGDYLKCNIGTQNRGHWQCCNGRFQRVTRRDYDNRRVRCGETYHSGGYGGIRVMYRSRFRVLGMWDD